MTLRTPFSPMHSELNAFLFAAIGEDKVGLELTVVSAMARSGLDPWAEAARLAALSPRAAAQGLIPVITQSSNGVDVRDVDAIADRLVRLLPKAGVASPIVRGTRKLMITPSNAASVVCLVLAIAFLAWTITERSAGVDEGAPSLATNGDTLRRP